MTFIQRIEQQSCGCDAQGLSKAQISIDEALDRIAAHTSVVAETETLSLGDAHGRILAEPILSSIKRPVFDNSAMDGYAVNTQALTGTGPWTLTVADRVVAGQSPDQILTGSEAARIFTGAPVPEGADAVIMQEEVKRVGSVIRICRRPAPGLNIRKAGSERQAGETVLAAGRCLRAPEIAASAAVDVNLVTVRRPVRIALLVTGDEVTQAGADRARAQISDVNTPMMKATLDRPSVTLIATEHGLDSREGLQKQLAEMARSVDLIITTGGISVGEEDHVKPAIEAFEGKIHFSGVALKPGKPVSFGQVGSALWLGLPGNPLSAFVAWHLFGDALLSTMSGAIQCAPARRHVVAGKAIRHKPGRCEMRLASIVGTDSLGRDVVTFEDASHSDRASQMPSADGLIYLPSDIDRLPEGALLEFQPFHLT